jgi:hypothetical protein
LQSASPCWRSALSNVVLVRQMGSFQEQLAVMIVASGIREKNGAC